MKITELRCSACDGTVKLDENNPNIAECEYCHTRFTIEWEQPGVHSGASGLRPLPGKIQYTPIRKEEKKSGWEEYGWKLVCGLAAAAFVAAAAWKGPELSRMLGQDTKSRPEAPKVVWNGNDAEAGSAADQASEEAQRKLPTGLLASFSESVFGKPVEEITGQEFAKIRWLEFRSGLDYRRVGYSFADPYEDSSAELTWLTFPREESVDLSCLPVFTGLHKLAVSQSLSPEDVAGLSLYGLSGYFDSLEEIAALLEQPKLVRELSVTGSPFSLAGIDQFPNLERLSLDADQIEEEKLLTSAKALKSLEVDMYDGRMDFTSLGMLSGLEELRIHSENLRDLSFVTRLKNLKGLYLEYGTFLTLEPLSELSQLEELSVVSCDELKDMSAVSGLTGLKSLHLDLPYGCPSPDLSGLAGLEALYLESFEETGFLRSMTKLTELTLDSCSVDQPSDFAGLSGLKKLTCTSFGAMERDYSFITQLPALEEVDLHGTATYGDLSGIFNMPTVKSLNISDMSCEINFDKIQENTSLEELAADHMSLYENVQVSGGGGIVYVDWDEVSFAEHLDFLGKLKGLKILSIQDNDLTGLEFAASLEALQSIDISDNYVTDLSPLSGLKALKQVNCAENPIANYEVLGDSVVILK